MKCSRCGCTRPECGDLVEVREFIQKGKDPVIEVCDPIQKNVAQISDFGLMLSHVMEVSPRAADIIADAVARRIKGE